MPTPATTATYGGSITCVETLAVNVPAISANGNTITQSGFNKAATLNSGTPHPVTDDAYFQKAMSSGAATIDLTAMTGTNGRTVDATGLKVQMWKFRNPATNANPITVTFGASNGYLLGGTAWKFILQPGQEIQGYGADATPDVDGTHKAIDIAGTGSQALDVVIVVG